MTQTAIQDPASTVDLEAQVLNATPAQLITMLLDGARASVMAARQYLQQDQLEQSHLAIAKAITIVDSGLKASVNEEHGEVAEQLIITYELIAHHLTQAALNNDASRLDIAEQMLDTLIDAWTRVTAEIDLELQVFGANAKQLITLLLDGARTSVINAKQHMQQGKIAERGAAISKAIDIVDSGLKASVNTEQGGEVAEQLVTAYDLMSYHLLQANLHSDEKRLDIVEQMLDTLLDAWVTATTESK